MAIEKSPLKDKYFEKKISELEKKPILPRVSVMDLALIGAIVLFLIGAALIWYVYPSKTAYVKPIKKPQTSTDFLATSHSGFR